MRKLIILAVSLVALAAVIAPLASAATTDANGVVTVSKGDIQSAMGWNNAKWDAAIGATDGVANVGSLITANYGSTPVDVPGGWLTLNGQIVANYPSDEYYKSSFTNPENWCNGWIAASSYWDNDADTDVTPIRNAQNKVTGFKVSATPDADADGYVEYTRHTTSSNCYGGATFVYHATSRWPVSIAGSGVSDVKVGGKAVTVTPYVAPAV